MRLLISVASVLLLALTGCGRSGTSAAANDACPHQIKASACPFCTPSLIESDGFCGEHGVAEALCSICRPYLKTAFRAKGDWCQEHNAPESQCMVCHPELKEKVRPGEHGA
jgi:cobalt-zinc-cadmium efflux system membrane fusion protein